MVIIFHCKPLGYVFVLAKQLGEFPPCLTVPLLRRHSSNAGAVAEGQCFLYYFSQVSSIKWSSGTSDEVFVDGEFLEMTILIPKYLAFSLEKAHSLLGPLKALVVETVGLPVVPSMNIQK